MESFPIVDVSYYYQHFCYETVPSSEFLTDKFIKKIAEELLSAFQDWGFVYLKGTGFSPEFVESLFDSSREFFHQSLEEKNRVLFNSSNLSNPFGYVPFKFETFDRNKPFDLKEAFDYLPWITEDIKSKLPQKFYVTMTDMFSKCHVLTMRLLRLLNLALRIEDPQFLEKAHKFTSIQGKNHTMLRSLYYPGVDKSLIQPSQLRCGEHTDYGTITLLFQDETGGLEVQSPNGNFIHATPIPNTIVVNAADLLERWTSGKIKSTKHRVVSLGNPEKPRQSIAFFCQPDDEVLVSCLDGSDTYQPVNSFNFLKERLLSSFTK
ncbi:uncharacterized protein LOC100209573 [Hydra vulgaris]|uniref:Uncharacterized protein LOC100209573 n=1 Tax=Hydra vulgaris TaxID=6087 RepID=A0ABM4CCF5_HYDVU